MMSFTQAAPQVSELSGFITAVGFLFSGAAAVWAVINTTIIRRQQEKHAVELANKVEIAIGKSDQVIKATDGMKTDLVNEVRAAALKQGRADADANHVVIAEAVAEGREAGLQQGRAEEHTQRDP